MLLKLCLRIVDDKVLLLRHSQGCVTVVLFLSFVVVVAVVVAVAVVAVYKSDDAP